MFIREQIALLYQSAMYLGKDLHVLYQFRAFNYLGYFFSHPCIFVHVVDDQCIDVQLYH